LFVEFQSEQVLDVEKVFLWLGVEWDVEMDEEWEVW
jgi:hypothetical protein